MRTSPKIYKVADRQQSGEAEKSFNIYDPERMERIRRFLSAKLNHNQDLNIASVLDEYRPPTHEYIDFNLTISPRTESRFISWYNSNLCVKMLMTFEKYYLGNNLDNRKTFERQAFLMEHVCRIRQIYNRVKTFGNLKLNDYADFKHLALFFEQIEYFICYEINQVEPMSTTELKNKIFDAFYDLCSDITEIGGFEDIDKIMTVELKPYHFERGRTSLQPLNQPPGVYTFDLSIIDQETKESFFENFTNEDWGDLFEGGFYSFVEDPLNYEEYRSNNHLFNPFSGIIDQQANQPF
jgi:hypothetical protein